MSSNFMKPLWVWKVLPASTLMRNVLRWSRYRRTWSPSIIFWPCKVSTLLRRVFEGMFGPFLVFHQLHLWLAFLLWLFLWRGAWPCNCLCRRVAYPQPTGGQNVGNNHQFFHSLLWYCAVCNTVQDGFGHSRLSRPID
jgi:hypothetical protein